MVEHRNLEHQNSAVRFEMILREFPRTTLQRQAGEAHHIELNMSKAKVINRRGEWGQNLPPKLVLEDNSKDGKRKTKGRSAKNPRPNKRQKKNNQQEREENTTDEEQVITGSQKSDSSEMGAAAAPLAPGVSPPESKGAEKMTESRKTKKLTGYRDRLTKGLGEDKQVKRSKPLVRGREMLNYMEGIKSKTKDNPSCFVS